MPKKCVVCGFKLNGLVTLAGNLRIYYGNEGSSKRKAFMVDFSDMIGSKSCVLRKIKTALDATNLPETC